MEENINGEAMLVSNVILDAREFYIGDEERTIEGVAILPINYEYSTIRTWLNGEIGDQDFSEYDEYVCDNEYTAHIYSNDTFDKVFLLSNSRVPRDEEGSGLVKDYSDYSTIQWLYTTEDEIAYYGYRTRTPKMDYSANTYVFISASNYSNYDGSERPGYSVVPAIRISL